ncbi:prolyl oligopeptidase family serine peptidase [Spirosoma rhododendri]|uniref:prolyl oligopeptidase n=1 Tax=Spirosoma rhododendri TaxID=2728024 RepID=A0A7L5DQ79_9BACT|nr:prolyl oligopeptidase family serine peptidase [Spirosoma rhododendri]QJD80624.1 S9 family peptidase [Spirosoma rhododendri]
MKISLLLPALFALTASAQTLPSTPKRPVVDTYFGKAVTDNYRWLEDMNSPETKDWFKAQGDYTNSVLDKIPGRNQLVETFVAYDKLKPVRYNAIEKRGNRYFYRKTLPSEKVSKLYTREGLTGPEKLLFDPIAYDKTRTYSVSSFSPSPNGQLVTIALQEGGAEVSTLYVMNVATRTFQPEKITAAGWVQWMPDNSSFVYTPRNSMDVKDPKALTDMKARLHRIGTEPSQDPDLFSRANDPTLGIRPEQIPILYLSDDYTKLYGILASVDNRADAFIADPSSLGNATLQWKRLAAPTDSVYSFLKLGSQLFLYSVKGTPKGQILVTDAANPNPSTATVLLPQGKLNITGIVSSKDYLFVTLNDGINDQIRQYDPRTNQWADVKLPLTGSAWLMTLDAPRSNDMILAVTSWKQPTTYYAYNPVTKAMTPSVFNVPATYPGVDELVVEEVEVPSHDGAMVPLSLIYKKGLKRDGSAVCFMEGYGAYGYSATPYFSTLPLAMLNKGVIIAQTHIRGGSEKGQNWYKAGYKTTKPNTWKDFIACGEYLVNNKYTSPTHLIGMGTSAGGILIGRAITERPDLFAAAISNVGCNNALRLENSPNGPVNTPEFGTVKDSTECMALYEMDAMQHVQNGTKYPAVICVGGMNDPRVITWQPGKFAAALQNASTSGKPVLMQVNYDNGHFTEDKAVTFRNFANMFAFALWQAGHPDFQASAQQTEMAGRK